VLSALLNHPEPSDQAGHRRRRGLRCGRPVGYDTQKYKGRNVIERSFNRLKNWRGITTRYDQLAITFRAAVVLAGNLRLATTSRRHALIASGFDELVSKADWIRKDCLVASRHLDQPELAQPA
jgi:hypothetical protein